MSTSLRRQQKMLQEIASLRVERVKLRGALADIVTMADIAKVRAYALKVLTDLPATAPWQSDMGDGDVGALGDAGGRHA